MLNIKKLLAHLLQTVPVVLYDYDGVVDTNDITFTQNATGYEKIEIFFKDNDGKRGSTILFKPQVGQIVPLTLASASMNNTAVYIKSKMYRFQGTYLERSRKSDNTYGYNGQGSITGTNVCSIQAGGELHRRHCGHWLQKARLKEPGNLLTLGRRFSYVEY
ncbi:MAG: hypothetical protein IJ860_09245 [Eubacterium sp.]|nr:hypothetical protein [Eubacterium sp.]